MKIFISIVFALLLSFLVYNHFASDHEHGQNGDHSHGHNGDHSHDHSEKPSETRP